MDTGYRVCAFCKRSRWAKAFSIFLSQAPGSFGWRACDDCLRARKPSTSGLHRPLTARAMGLHDVCLSHRPRLSDEELAA